MGRFIMANHSLSGVLQHLRKVAAVQTYQGLSDRELLARFVEAHEEAAFTVLIERHGPMVLGVCRRSLPNLHDAEDACQATFLVLARKAASVRKQTSISSWLHGVACRVAISLKRDHARRRNRERGVDRPAPRDPAAEVSWREVQTILDDELQQLPERYRTPLILCYLECMTRDEAAQHLGLSTASLRGRLERARDLLRRQLASRGVTLAAAMSAAAVGPGLAKAAPSPTLVVSLTKAAVLMAAGQPLSDSVVAAEVITLTQEILKNMFLTKLKLGTAAILCAGLLVAMIGGSLTSQSIAQDPTQKQLVSQWTNIRWQDGESDADFIRRLSKELRGIEPTSTEVHFFVSSKDPNRRQKVIDLFIQDRQAKLAKTEWHQKKVAEEPKSEVQPKEPSKETEKAPLDNARPIYPLSPYNPIYPYSPYNPFSPYSPYNPYNPFSPYSPYNSYHYNPLYNPGLLSRDPSVQRQAWDDANPAATPQDEKPPIEKQTDKSIR